MHANTPSIVHVAHSTHAGLGGSSRAAGAGVLDLGTAASFEAWPEPSCAGESQHPKSKPDTDVSLNDTHVMATCLVDTDVSLTDTHVWTTWLHH